LFVTIILWRFTLVKKSASSWGRFSCVSLLALLVTGLNAGVARANDAVYTAGSFDKTGDPALRNYNWQNELNWEPEGVPGAGDVATIPAGKTVFLVDSVTVRKLLTAGSINGSTNAPSLTVTEQCDWTGGDIGSNGMGTFTIPEGAQWNISGDDSKTFYGPLATLAGQVNWAGNGNIRATGGVFNNSGSFIISGNAFFGHDDNRAISTFNNTGTLIKRSSSGQTSFNGYQGSQRYTTVFNNTGLVAVESGDLLLGSGTSSGTFNLSEGTRVLVNDAHRFEANTLLGTGTLKFTAGNPRLVGNIAASGRLEFETTDSNGVVTGENAVLSGGGRFVHRSGQLNGTVTVAPDFSYDFSGGTAVLNSVTLINRGNMTWSSGDIQGYQATLDNAVGGTFRAQSTGTFYKQYNSIPFSVSNAGTFLQESTGTSIYRLDSLANTGTVEVKSGEMVFNAFSYTQTGGTTRLNGGNITTNNNGEGSIFMRIDGGSLSGSGAINGKLRNGGVVSPGIGTAPGILNIVGDYEQTAGGSLSVKLRGLDASVPQFDQLKISGNAAFNGTLNTTLVGDYLPNLDSKFPVVTYASQSGIFTSLSSTGGRKFLASYNPTNLTLQLVPLPTISVEIPSVTEGNSGTKSLPFTLKLSEASDQVVTVKFATSDGTAKSGQDYTASSGTVTFASGETSKVVKIAIIGDRIDEADETLNLNLSNAVGATLTTTTRSGTITNDDGPPKLSVKDVTVKEGNSGSLGASFLVTLSTASSKSITVNFTTADGTAKAPSDYTTKSGTLTFSPGQTSKTVSVAVKGEALNESDETFGFKLSTGVNVSVADATGVGTITNDDALPALSVKRPTITEGDSGNQVVSFTLTLSQPSGQNVSVVAKTGAATSDPATVGYDYTALAATKITFLPGETKKTVNITIKGDLLDEADEKFNFVLGSIVNATLTTPTTVATIVDNDATPLLSINDLSLSEGNSGTKLATFTVKLSARSGREVSVDFASVKGTASSPSDYSGITGSLTFAPGETSKTISIAVKGDTLVETDEKFTVILSRNRNASLSKATGSATILNDDSSTSPALATSEESSAPSF
jgi:hypothetical protein